jgi:ion channel-forming bestrophin family protein
MSFKNNTKWFQTTLHLPNSVLPKVFIRVLVCTIFALFIAILNYRGYGVNLPILGSAVPSIIVGLLLVFRTNTAYERFWEGRKLWGTINNNIRNLARQIWLTNSESEKQKENLINNLWILAVSAKNQLRSQPLDLETQKTLETKQNQKLENSSHLFLTISFLVQEELNQFREVNKIDNVTFGTMQSHLNNIVDSHGGCERILKTPMPMAYSIHLKQLILLYCFTLPFQFVGQLGFWSILVVAIVSFAMMGIEEIGLEIENPFGSDSNDLPLDNICINIKNNLDELIKFKILS